jgi:hypothetical protein
LAVYQLLEGQSQQYPEGKENKYSSKNMSKVVPASQLKVSKLDYNEDNGERYSLVAIPPLQVKECVTFDVQLGPDTAKVLIPLVSFMTQSATAQYAYTVSHVKEANKFIFIVHNISPLPTVQAIAAVYIKQL